MDGAAWLGGQLGGNVGGASAEGCQMSRSPGPQPLHSAAGGYQPPTGGLGRSEWLLSTSPAVILPELEEGMSHLPWSEVSGCQENQGGLRRPVLSTVPKCS